MSNSGHELPLKNDTTMTGKQNRTIFSLVLYVILGPGFALYGQVRSDWKHWESLGSLHWAARCSTEKKKPVRSRLSIQFTEPDLSEKRCCFSSPSVRSQTDGSTA